MYESFYPSRYKKNQALFLEKYQIYVKISKSLLKNSDITQIERDGSKS